MKHKKLLFAFLIGACAFQACQNINKNSNDPDSLKRNAVDSTQAAMADTVGMHNAASPSSFMEKAAIGGMMEVELGKLAQQKSSNAKVQQFGALMVKDHSKANDELKGIAKAENVMLPTAFPADDQKHMDEMKKMSGKDFDKHYMDMMVNDHVKTIDLFKTEATSSDTAISKFVNKVLPIIQGHHQKAVEINKGL